MVLKTIKSKDEFLEYKKHSAIVMFTGERCPACVQAKPKFLEIAKKGKTPHLIIDRTKQSTLLTDADIGLTPPITGVPTFVKYTKNDKGVITATRFNPNFK